MYSFIINKKLEMGSCVSGDNAATGLKLGGAIFKAGLNMIPGGDVVGQIADNAGQAG